MTEPAFSNVAHSHRSAPIGSDRNTASIVFTDEELSLFRQGLPDGADHAQREQFAWYSVKLYKSKGWCNDTLSEYFAEDFKSYSEEDIAELSASTRRELRDLLRRQGVYVKKCRNVLIATALYEVVKDDIPWPEDDIEAPTNQRSSAISPSDGRISSRLNYDVSFSLSKNVGNVSKAYTRDEERFSGREGDKFERKLKCLMSDVCRTAWRKLINLRHSPLCSRRELCSTNLIISRASD